MKKFRYPIIVGVIIIDQIVKFLVKGSMQVGDTFKCIGNIMSITYVQNTGAAFSMLAGKRVLLIALPVIACIIAMVYMEMKIKEAHWTMPLAISLIVSGGLGNLIDRAFIGFVTDMFDFHFWPVFNVADIAVCVGCGFLLIYVIFFDKSLDTKKPKES